MGKGLANFKPRARATATGSACSCAGASSASAESPRRRPGRFAQRSPHEDWEDLVLHWAALTSRWEGFRFQWGAYQQKRHLASSRFAKASPVRIRQRIHFGQQAKMRKRHKAKHTGRAELTRSIRSRSRRLTPSGIAVAGGGESVARETEPQRIPFGAAWQAGVASDTRRLQL